MTRKRILITLLFPLLASCNYRFFVDKHYIVREDKGYLVFNNDQIVFFPTKDTIDAKFLADKHKKEGYKVEYDTDWLDSLSTNYSNLLFIENDKRLSIIPVKIRNYLGELWRPVSDKGTIDYKWNNEKYTIRYETADWRQILMISAVRESDIKRIKDLKMPIDTSKFVPPHWHPVQ
jgi:hypothetical protein